MRQRAQGESFNKLGRMASNKDINCPNRTPLPYPATGKYSIIMNIAVGWAFPRRRIERCATTCRFPSVFQYSPYGSGGRI